MFSYPYGRGATMPVKNEDLHGFVPDQADVALLLIDVINDLEFDGSETLLQSAVPMARKIAALKRRGEEGRGPVSYVHDKLRPWQCGLPQPLARRLGGGVH